MKDTEKNEIKAFARIFADGGNAKTGEPSKTSDKRSRANTPKQRKKAETASKTPRTAKTAKTANKIDGAGKERSIAKSAVKTGNKAVVSNTKKNTVSVTTPSAKKANGKSVRNTRKPSAKAPEIKLDSNAELRIIPLGGLNEIGKNMTMYECGEDRLIVDCGMSFPDDELYGIDVVIPDFSYVVEHKDSIRGLVITHGHEDHIGSIPYLLKEINVPIYGTNLTIGLIRAKLSEHGLDRTAKLNVIEAGDIVKLGCMSVEPIRVNHSIPGAVAYAIRTPAGMVIQTGDFKVDYTPVFDKTIDLARFGQLGDEGVLALLSDSTNVEHPGNSTTESKVGASLETLFYRAEGKRLIIASFASNIQRVQQIVDLAKRHGRKVALSGRSMENYTAIARELGYLTIDDDILIGINEIKRYRPSDLIIITTGSQGEAMSALSRMSTGTHKNVSIGGDDVIIISATPIPGNEKTVTRVINDLLKLGSDVIYESMYEVHASGHACQDEQKLMIQLTRPKYFMPVHGEFKHLVKHANLAKSLGIAPGNVIIADLGNVIRFKNGKVTRQKPVKAGRVLVDGLGVGDVGSVVLRDRKHLSSDGLIVVVATIDNNTGELISGPDIISRGFVYVKESEQLIVEAKELIRDIISSHERRDATGDIKAEIREKLNFMMYNRTKRSPMILPIIMEV